METQTNQTIPLLTVREVRNRLSISNSKAHRLITSGAIKASRIGKTWHVEASDLEAYIAANSNQKASSEVAP